MAERAQRRLAAIVAADVAGYSRLVGADEEGTLQALKEHRRDLIDPLIEEHGGRIANTAGDSLLLEFPSVVDAVRCAVAVQHGISGRNQSIPSDRQVQFRIGINVGDVITEGRDLFGDGVNIAARLEQYCQPGSIVLSDAAFQQIKGKVDAKFDDCGEQVFKNIKEPIRAWLWAERDDTAVARLIADDTQSLPRPNRPSIAVLPFDNMSANEDQEYFSDGLTEDIITELSRFSTLFVIARNSSFTYKGKSIDVRQISRELGVRYIIEGSVRKAGNRLRINAQVIEAETGVHLLAERYDRQLDDIFEVQEDLTRRIVGSVAPAIEYHASERLAILSTVSSSAYDLAMQATRLNYSCYRENRPDHADVSLELSQRAISIDERCIDAHIAKSFAYFLKALFRWAPGFDTAIREAISAAQKAKDIDDTDPRALAYLGASHLYAQHFEEAILHSERSVELNRNYAFAQIVLAQAYAMSGESERARPHAQTALRLSPKDRFLGACYLALTLAAYVDGDLDDALYWVERAILADPYYPIRRSLIIAYYAEMDNLKEATPHIERLKAIAPDFIPSLFRGQGLPYKNRQHNSKLLEGLRKAGLAPVT